MNKHLENILGQGTLYFTSTFKNTVHQFCFSFLLLVVTSCVGAKFDSRSGNHIGKSPIKTAIADICIRICLVSEIASGRDRHSFVCPSQACVTSYHTAFPSLDNGQWTLCQKHLQTYAKGSDCALSPQSHWHRVAMYIHS